MFPTMTEIAKTMERRISQEALQSYMEAVDDKKSADGSTETVGRTIGLPTMTRTMTIFNPAMLKKVYLSNSSDFESSD